MEKPDSSRRKWEILDDTSLNKTIEDLQSHIDFYHAQYVMLRARYSDDAQVEELIGDVIDALADIRNQLVPFAKERMYRDEHDIKVTYEYKTPDEQIESTIEFARTSSRESLEQILITYQSTRETLIHIADLSRDNQLKSRKLGLIRQLEDTNSAILSNDRELNVTEQKIKIIEDELQKRSSLKYKIRQIPLVAYRNIADWLRNRPK